MESGFRWSAPGGRAGFWGGIGPPSARRPRRLTMRRPGGPTSSRSPPNRPLGIAALLERAGWAVSIERVEPNWRQEGLKVPGKQPKKSRLWLNDGSCVRLRPERPNHVWGPTTSSKTARTMDGNTA